MVLYTLPLFRYSDGKGSKLAGYGARGSRVALHFWRGDGRSTARARRVTGSARAVLLLATVIHAKDIADHYMARVRAEGIGRMPVK